MEIKAEICANSRQSKNSLVIAISYIQCTFRLVLGWEWLS